MAAALAALVGCSGNRPPADEARGTELPPGEAAANQQRRPSQAEVAPRLSGPALRDSIPLADIHRDLAYAVKLDVAPDSASESRAPLLRASVTVRNISLRTVRLEHSACVVNLTARRGSNEVRAPAWESEHRATWPVASPYDCPLPLIIVPLAPGHSYTGTGIGELKTWVPLAEIYGDSLPTGRYWFKARLTLNRDSITVPGGDVELGPSRFLLGPHYPLDGFRYRAEALEVTTPRQTVEVRVEVSSRGMRADLTRYISRDCPILLHAYRSADAQRTAPPAPVWVSPRSCTPDPEPVRLTAGESRMLTRRVTAREVLGDSLAAGRYFFTAIVPLLDPSTSRSKRVWLDMGAFDLRAPSQSRQAPSKRVAEPRTRSRGPGRS